MNRSVEMSPLARALAEFGRVELRFCVPCNRRDAVHLNGVCSNADRHLAPCPCGRPTPGGGACSSCTEGETG